MKKVLHAEYVPYAYLFQVQGIEIFLNLKEKVIGLDRLYFKSRTGLEFGVFFIRFKSIYIFRLQLDNFALDGIGFTSNSDYTTILLSREIKGQRKYGNLSSISISIHNSNHLETVISCSLLNFRNLLQIIVVGTYGQQKYLFHS